MSLTVLNWVLQQSETTGTDRLVLIALADYANDDGGGSFAKLKKICHKARTKERATQYALRRLEADGRIERTGTTPRGTAVYRIVMTEGGADHAPPGATACTPGCNQVHPAHSITEPSTNDQGKKKGARGGSLFVPNPDDDVDQVIVECFEAWRIGVGKRKSSQLTTKRAGKIRARLQEAGRGAPDGASREDKLAFARNELLEAVKGMATSRWHRDEGHTDFDQLFRERERIEFFVGKLAKTEREGGESAVKRFAEYDAAVAAQGGGGG